MKTPYMNLIFLAATSLVVIKPAKAQIPMFEPPLHLGTEVNSPSPDSTAIVSSDGLTLWVSQSDLPGQVFPSIQESTRASTDIRFGVTRNIQGSTPAPRPISLLGSVSGDGLSLYYDSSLPGGAADLFVVTRPSIDSTFDFANPKPLTELNSSGSDQAPHVSKDGLTIAFASSRSGGAGFVDLYIATRKSISEPFDAPVNLQEINSSRLENTPRLTDDQLSLYFYSDRAGGFGGRDIYVSTRDSVDEPFDSATNLGDAINTEYDEAHPYYSEELSTLFFSSDRPGGIPNDPLFAAIPGSPGSWDIWQATLATLEGDFDRDGTLTARDIDLLSSQLGATPVDLTYDTNSDGVVNLDDHRYWVESEDFANTLIGDNDLDGTVNFSDFLALSAGFGKVGGWAEGDFDGNGQVEFSDFLALSENFGQSGTAIASVPEPSCAQLMVLTCLTLLPVIRRERTALLELER